MIYLKYVVLEGFGTGNHGCCLEKLTRKRRLVKHRCSFPSAFTVMSFDLSSRFLYTPEASSPHMYFFAFTLFFLDISGSDKQPSFVLFRSQLQFSSGSGLRIGELPSDGEHPLHHGLGFAGLRVAAELLIEAASAKRGYHSI